MTDRPRRATIVPEVTMSPEEWEACRPAACQLLVLRAEDVFRGAEGEITRCQQYGEEVDPRLYKIKLDSVATMARLLGVWNGIQTRQDPGQGADAGSVSDEELRSRVAGLLAQSSV